MNSVAPLIAAVVAAIAISGCQRNTGEPRSEVHVLVDLSETWFNDASAEHNKAVLSEIGGGIAQFATQSEPPIAAQYRVIGQVSLGRLPLCDAIYDPTQKATKAKRPDYLVRTPASLMAFLRTDCPTKILKQPGEGMTEITQAINASAAGMTHNIKNRVMIIASDLLEESAADEQVPESLADTRVLLVYRPVSDDLRHPANLTARVNGWRERLTKAGASEVTTVPDDSIKASAVAAFLFKQ